jgi:NADH-quinone oxidoreductase subunit H
MTSSPTLLSVPTLKQWFDAFLSRLPVFLQDHSQILMGILLLVAALVVLGGVALYVMAGVFIERKLSAHIQDRVGPFRVGWHGFLQLLVDGVKLGLKEDLCPAAADRPLFVIALGVVLAGCFATFVVMPFSWAFTVADLDIGVLYVVCVGAAVLVGIVMAGWGSNNKWGLLGAMRGVAVVMSYEIPVGLCVIMVAMLVGSLSTQQIVLAQASGWTTVSCTYPLLGPAGWWTADPSGNWNWGMFNWFAFRYFPFLFIAAFCFFVAALAEANRTPFDLQEAESELVAGFHTEYTGLRWAYFMLAEYADMLILSMLSTTLFWGGWLPLQITNFHSPDPYVFWPLAAAVVWYLSWLYRRWYHPIGEYMLGVFLLSLVMAGALLLWLVPSITWFLGKSLFHVFVMMWLRWTLPRPRIDQLMYLCWKVLLPLSFVNFIAVGVWHVIRTGP